jgi:RNA polymerase sigma-70 factor (ECF subfamily)
VRIEETIVSNLKTFVSFARKRVGDPHLAEDVVQDSLVKALEAGRKPSTEDDTVTWFYRILRRSIIDLYRRRDAAKRALQKFEKELPESPGVEDERLLCGCFRRLLPELPKQYREALERVDLEGQEPAEAAAKLGLSRNSFTVRLHRARKALRKELERNCSACSKHGCLDCTCR